MSWSRPLKNWALLPIFAPNRRIEQRSLTEKGGNYVTLTQSHVGRHLGFADIASDRGFCGYQSIWQAGRPDAEPDGREAQDALVGCHQCNPGNAKCVEIAR